MASIKEIPLFSALSKIELKNIESRLKEKTFNKGDILFSEDANCRHIFIVQSGRIKLYRTAAAGREQIFEILDPGDTCACHLASANCTCPLTAEAEVRSKTWLLSRNDYSKLVNSNTKTLWSICDIFIKRNQTLNNLVEEISLKDARKRLIKFLLDALEKKSTNTKEDVLFIPFTREDIAKRLGAARETITRYLSQLRKLKLIELKPYQIIILDKEGLRKFL